MLGQGQRYTQPNVAPGEDDKHPWSQPWRRRLAAERLDFSSPCGPNAIAAMGMLDEEAPVAIGRIDTERRVVARWQDPAVGRPGVACLDCPAGAARKFVAAARRLEGEKRGD
jgi:hypothetical protein